MHNQIDILGLSLDALKDWVVELGHKPYRGLQIFQALHKQLVTNWDGMMTLPAAFRTQLAECAFIERVSVVKVQASQDGTRKYQFRTKDGHLIESVFIPNAATDGRNTLCISSQVGCAMGCTFCATAKLNLTRNLSSAEIIAQLYEVHRDLVAIGWKNQVKPESDLEDERLIHNIVYMGMGEPLHNFDNVLGSIRLLCEQQGQNYAAKRITVSTSGVVKNIERLGRESKVHIAISLNASTNAVRDVVMPVNKKWNIEELLAACKSFPIEARRRITFEYVMLDGINDFDEDAVRVVGLLKGIQAKVNLIPFNEHPLSSFKKPPRERVLAFQRILLDNHMTVFIRSTRGDDIDAACGMLGAQKLENARGLQ
jgi:23S rRNA (adenine2503-C2)-methyltransferase